MRRSLRSFRLSFLILPLLLAATPVQGQVSVADSLALVAIYNATDGPNWQSNPGWLSGPVSSWGFLAVENNRVTGLGLSQLGLKGTLPTEIGNLTELRLLSLAFNQLSGPLPASMGNLTKLETLNLERNTFTGNIPESFGNLVALKELVFWGNQLTGLPSTIGNLKQLTILNGFENQLTALPEGIGGLSALRLMSLSSNNLQGSIPASIGSITTLLELDLSWNENLSGPIPATINNLWQLQKLYLYDTAITGPLPAQWGGMVSLERLWVFQADLTGSIPGSIGDMPMLGSLNLSNNRLSGPLPAGLGNTPATEIYLFNNELTGELPPEIGNASNLVTLQLNNNHLTGAVPESMTTMPALRGLSIKENNIEDLPDFRGLPSGFLALDVAGNRLHFDDLQNNLGLTFVSYAPQQSFDVLALDQGTVWALGCPVGGTNNTYQWFFENRTAASGNSQDAAFPVQKPVTERYYCEAKNQDFIDLILTSNLWPEEQSGTEAPVAAFTASPEGGPAPLLVTFNASTSSDPDGGDIQAWSWTFGDGQGASGVTTTHTYTSAGSYTVTLTVTDDEGETGTASSMITVTEPSSNQMPTAVITVNTSSGPAPLTVTFDGSGSSDPEGSPLEYAWDFGDGSDIEVGVQVSHTYTTPGVYTSLLLVLDPEGGASLAEKLITVTEPGGDPTSAELLLHLPFDGTIGFPGYNETNWSSWAPDRFGNPQSAIQLSESAVLVLPFLTDGTPRTAVSVGAWIELGENTRDASLIFRLADAQGETTLGLWGPSDVEGIINEISGTAASSSYTQAKAGILAKEDGWFHYMVTYDGTRQTVYMNGYPVLVGHPMPVGEFTIPQNNGFLRFGQQLSGMDVRVDDFRLYGGALTADEVRAIARRHLVFLEGSTRDASAGEVYEASNGGFLFGTNGYLDRAKAQLMELPSGEPVGFLSAIRYWLGYSHTDAYSQDVSVAVWSGTAASGPVDLLYASPVFNMVTVENEQWEYQDPTVVGGVPMTFVLPDVEVDRTFFVSIHFEDYGAPYERYALVGGPPLGQRVDSAWEMDVNANWFNVSDAWFGGSDGAVMWIDVVELTGSGGATATEPEVVPTATRLLAAYPNPFNPQTLIPFELAEPAAVRLTVHDLLGREVAVLVDGRLPSGRHEVRFDASGRASGMYLIRLTADGQMRAETRTRSIVLLR
ncbi:MAG: PKD domain-containing protein [Rhodothermales bacterium]